MLEEEQEKEEEKEDRERQHCLYHKRFLGHPIQDCQEFLGRGVHSVGSVKTEPNYPKPNYHFTFSITEPNYPKTELTEPNLFRLIRSVNRINRNFQNLIFLIFIY